VAFMLYQRVESYLYDCLPDFVSSTSTGLFSVGQGSIPATAIFVPLVSNSMYPSFYFVGLNDISVGGERLLIPPAVLGRGGTIVDSGTVITQLVPQAYNALKTSFRSKTQNLPSAKPFSILDTCYDLSSYSQVRIPTITVHFQNNADVVVSASAFFLPFIVTDLRCAWHSHRRPNPLLLTLSGTSNNSECEFLLTRELEESALLLHPELRSTAPIQLK
jgi:hypothetical protein